MQTQYSPYSYPIAASASFIEASYSYYGMVCILNNLQLFTSLAGWFGLASALFTIAIEGEVFLQNTDSAIRYFNDKKSLNYIIAQNLLIDYCNNNLNSTNKFIMQYRYFALAAQAIPISIQIATDDTHLTNNIWYGRLLMERCLIGYFDSSCCLPAEIKTELDKVFIENKKHFNFLINQKQSFIYCFHAINAAAILGESISSLFVAQQFLLFMGLSGIPLFAIAGVFSLIAGLTFGIIFYRTYMQIILNDSLSTWWNQFYATLTNGSTGKKILTCMTAIIFATLLLVLILSSAGTFWQTGIDSQKFMYNTCYTTLTVLTGLCVSIFTVAYVIYNAKNIIESIYQVPDIDFLQWGTSFLDSIKKYFLYEAQNFFTNATILWITFNPLYILLALTGAMSAALHLIIDLTFAFWNVFSFIGHCIGEGVTTDNAFYLTPLTSTLYGTFIEVFTDLHYFTHDCQHHAENSQLIKKEDDGDEHHSNIPAKILCILLSPLLLLDCALYKAHSGKTWKDSFSLTFLSRFKLAPEPSHNHVISSVPVSDFWRKADEELTVIESSACNYNN